MSTPSPSPAPGSSPPREHIEAPRLHGAPPVPLGPDRPVGVPVEALLEVLVPPPSKPPSAMQSNMRITGLVYDIRLIAHKELIWKEGEEEAAASRAKPTDVLQERAAERRAYLADKARLKETSALLPDQPRSDGTVLTTGRVDTERDDEDEDEDEYIIDPGAKRMLSKRFHKDIGKTVEYHMEVDGGSSSDDNDDDDEEEEEDIDDEEDHPESPLRIVHVYRAIQDSGCITRCVRLPIRELTIPELLLAHSPGYITRFLATQYMDKYELKRTEAKFNSVYLCAESVKCARLSAGGVVSACGAVMRGEVRNAFAVIRPPGHHAERNKAMGFCLLSNVVIATKVSQQHFGAKKVLIFDWDIHHGNGTQKAFYDDPSVMYISIHRWEEGSFYPTGNDGAPWAVGQGVAKGANVNIAWSVAGMNDADYLLAFDRVVMPIAKEFSPDLVIVSAGFDSAHGDQLGGCHVSPRGYAQMLKGLMDLAGGKVVVALEGGYNLHATATSAAACARVLTGMSSMRKITGPHGNYRWGECQEARNDIQRTIVAHLPYHPCLRTHSPSSASPEHEQAVPVSTTTKEPSPPPLSSGKGKVEDPDTIMSDAPSRPNGSTTTSPPPTKISEVDVSPLAWFNLEEEEDIFVDVNI